MDIQNRVIIVTGTSEGIGAATARLLATHGAKLALAARSADKLKGIVEEITEAGGTAFAVKTDLRQQTDITKMIEQVRDHFGGIDILINNAGQAMGGTIEHLNLDSYRQIIELNIFAVLRAMQVVIPIMREQGGGMIVNISSMVSKMALPGISAYASTKYALNGLSLTARAELANDNIRVVVVYPRLTATSFVQNGIGYGGYGVRRTAGTPSVATGQVIDSPEHVAHKIVEAIQNEPAEQYME